jgi:hypothetical protein
MAHPVMALGRDQKKIFFVVLVMARSLPEIDIEDVRGHYFLEASLDVLAAHKVD